MKDAIEGKYRRIKYTVGITAVVYLSFRYVLPLVIPFLLALLLAIILIPVVSYVCEKLHIKESLAATLILTVLLAVMGWLIWIVGCTLWGQMQRVFAILPEKLQEFSNEIYAVSDKCEQMAGVSKGSISLPLQELIQQAGVRMQTEVFNQSLQHMTVVLQQGMNLLAGGFIAGLSCVIMIRDRMIWKRRFQRSNFYMEGRLILDKLGQAGGHWIRVQLIIMSIVIGICVIGLFIIGNSYAALAGIGIGILDALPIFGTGTIFVPWIIIKIFQRQWIMALELSVLYLITYAVREILESKMMGDSIGMTALEFLIAVYIGWQIFGFGGFILGPAALLIIRMGLLLLD